jgi:hypothetical protein
VLARPITALRAPDRSVARATALLALQRHGVLTRTDLDQIPAGERFEPTSAHREQYGIRQAQFEAAYAALLPISEALL